MWKDNFIDVLSVVFANIWFWLGVVVLCLVAVVIAYTRMDDNDRKLEQMEKEASQRLQERLTQSLASDPSAAPRERMDTLMIPTREHQAHGVEDLLTRYQFSLEVVAVGDTHALTLVDRKFFGLRNKRMVLENGEELLGATLNEWRKALSRARTNMNRRAQRVGLMEKNPGRGRYARRAAA